MQAWEDIREGAVWLGQDERATLYASTGENEPPVYFSIIFSTTWEMFVCQLYKFSHVHVEETSLNWFVCLV